jgi:hypothetical protein
MEKIGFAHSAVSPSLSKEAPIEEGASCPLDVTDKAVISGKRESESIYSALIAKAGREEAPADHVIEATDTNFDCIAKCSSTPAVFIEFHNPG